MSGTSLLRGCLRAPPVPSLPPPAAQGGLPGDKHGPYLLPAHTAARSCPPCPALQPQGGLPGSEQGPHAPPGTTELPTCPVCLERLDEHISGIVTTVCNHRWAMVHVQRGAVLCSAHTSCAQAWALLGALSVR